MKWNHKTLGKSQFSHWDLAVVGGLVATILRKPKHPRNLARIDQVALQNGESAWRIGVLLSYSIRELLGPSVCGSF